MNNHEMNRISFLWLSLGENCLPDDILKRHGRKSFSTPYSSGRSNIDYALQLERENYEGFLDKANLVYGDFFGMRVVRSARFNACDPIYSSNHMNGFEITHHDPLANDEHRRSLERKVQRLIDIKNHQDSLFLYFHRISKASDLEMIRAKLRKFRDFYQSYRSKCTIVLFYQNIIEDESLRRIEMKPNDDYFYEFAFHTRHTWEGSDQEIFWARIDDDLIVEMFSKIDNAMESRGILSRIKNIFHLGANQ